MSRRRRRNPPARTVANPSAGQIYPTLDLHGLTADEAQRAAARWIDSRAADGEGVVRLITGRGLHSIGPAVLPSAIEEVLRRLAGGPVRKYEREPGGGAYRVYLNPARGSSSGATRGDPGLSPELLRAAAEMLSELGVEPHPALIEAEARRLEKERRNQTT